MTNNDLGPDTIQSILPLMPTLISLNLSNCKIGNKGAIDLANILTQGEKGKETHKYSLEVLELANNGITLPGFIQLINRFRTSTTLISLNLASNRLEND